MKQLASARFVISTLLSSLFPFVLVCAISTTVFAQDLDNVTITGRVLDPNNAIIPGATIEAMLVRTGATRTTVTDDEGRYRLIQLEPGIYTLRASFAGFATQEKKDLEFIAGKNAQIDFTLVPGGVTVDPIVVVSTDTPAVDTTRTVVGGTVTTEEVEALAG